MSVELDSSVLKVRGEFTKYKGQERCLSLIGCVECGKAALLDTVELKTGPIDDIAGQLLDAGMCQRVIQAGLQELEG